VPGREGHMPGILTMIQVGRSTPAPSVIIVTILSLLYLTSRSFTYIDENLVIFECSVLLD
jgi:hypothetical protein